MSRPRRLARLLAAPFLAAVLACAGLVTVAVPTAGAAPAPWDSRLAPIAKEVERLRGLKFEHSVPVEFLSDQAFDKRVSVRDKLSSADKRELERSESEFRAVGLVAGDVDLESAFDELQTSSVLAFYDPKTKQVTVRGKDLGVDTRVTLAHELTHALQDQHFDITRLQRDAGEEGSQAVRALVEGDAVRVQRLYVSQLSAADQAAYEAADQAGATKALAEVRAQGVPDALSAFFEAPYALGPPMLAVAASNGKHGIDDLFRHPPVDDAAFVTPSTLLGKRSTVKVATPTLVAGERRRGAPSEFGAFALYLMLAVQGDPATALAAADGWGGDSMITYTSDGRTCLRAAFRGRTDPDTARLSDAITAWAATMPSGAARVEHAGRDVVLTACDPGTAAAAPPRSALGALIVADLRNEVLGEVLQSGMSVATADCIATKLIADPVVAPLVRQAEIDPNAEPSAADLSALQRKVVALTTACAAR